MANFERNDNLNEIIFTHSYSINRSLIFFHIIPARSHLTASSPRKDEYPTPSFYTPFFQFFLSCPPNCYNLWRSYFHGNTTLIGTCSALSPFDFNSASFFTLRLSVYSSYRDRVEGGTRRASAPPPPLLKKTCRAKHAPILPPA